MKRKIKVFLACILAFPQILTFVFVKIMGGVIVEDLSMWKRVYRLESKGDILAFSYLFFSYPELRSIYYWRLGKPAKFLFFWFPGRSSLYLFTNRNNVDGGFYVVHGWGTVVNAKSIGKNFCIGQNATIGSRNCKEPVIGNNVSVWTNAIVLGDIAVGDNCQIGAGAVVVKSLPNDSIVVPSKSMIIKQSGQRVNVPL